MQIRQLCDYLQTIAPLQLAEDWDNVGLIVGDAAAEVERVMTCLTVTPETVAEAIDRQAQLVVTHHPFPFRPTKRITTADPAGRLLWQLIGSGISIYSPHTAWDSAAEGINQQLAEACGLTNIGPLRPLDEMPTATDPVAGSGRCGQLLQPEPLSQLIGRVKQFLSIDGLKYVGDPQRHVQAVAIACGSAGEFLGRASELGCDLFILGETSFHTCLDAQALGIALLLPGHYASERFALETLAERLAVDYPDLEVWASRMERDPVRHG